MVHKILFLFQHQEKEQKCQTWFVFVDGIWRSPCSAYRLCYVNVEFLWLKHVGPFPWSASLYSHTFHSKLMLIVQHNANRITLVFYCTYCSSFSEFSSILVLILSSFVPLEFCFSVLQTAIHLCLNRTRPYFPDLYAKGKTNFSFMLYLIWQR